MAMVSGGVVYGLTALARVRLVPIFSDSSCAAHTITMSLGPIRLNGI